VVAKPNHKFGVVVGRFNDLVTKLLLEGAMGAFESHGVDPSSVEVSCRTMRRCLPPVHTSVQQQQRCSTCHMLRPQRYEQHGRPSLQHISLTAHCGPMCTTPDRTMFTTVTQAGALGVPGSLNHLLHPVTQSHEHCTPAHCCFCPPGVLGARQL
jgi:hypothetical protein